MTEEEAREEATLGVGLDHIITEMSKFHRWTFHMPNEIVMRQDYYDTIHAYREVKEILKHSGKEKLDHLFGMKITIEELKNGFWELRWNSKRFIHLPSGKFKLDDKEV